MDATPEPRRRARAAPGFTLLEVVVAVTIVAIMAGALVPLLIRPQLQQRYTETVSELAALEAAIAGHPELGDFGFLGTLGRLPDAAALSELLEQGTLAGPALRLGVPRGWNGPYLQGASATPLNDGWGQAYVLETATGGLWRLRSFGPDRVSGGGDDIVLPAEGSYRRSVGTLSVELLAVRGSRTLLLDDAWVDVVTLTVANGADSSADLALTCNPVGGSCTFTNVPFGRQALDILTNASAPCAECTFRRSVTITRPAVAASVAVELPADPRPSAFGCTGPNGTTTAPDGLGNAAVTLCSVDVVAPAEAAVSVQASGAWAASSGGECVLVIQVDGAPSATLAFTGAGDQAWTPAITRSTDTTSVLAARTAELSFGTHTVSYLLKANTGSCTIDSTALAGLLVTR
jgi:prepilin-type N-terminal cleavage/methylation domain-containing protein